MRIVYTSGTFDLFHIGHLNVLRRSKALGDYLIVGVSTDELVETYKVKSPIIPYENRAEIVRHLDIVDQVVTQETLFDRDLMKRLGATIMTIGSDWKEKENDGLTMIMDDPDIHVVFLPYTTSVSTTEIKEAIKEGGWQRDRE